MNNTTALLLHGQTSQQSLEACGSHSMFKVSVTGKVQVLTIKQQYICKLIVEEGGQM
jgi:hypothetical protein